MARRRPVAIRRRNRMVIGEVSLVAPLIGVDVVPTGRILQTDSGHPITTECNCCPRLPWRQLFLADVMRESTTVDSNTTAEHQCMNCGTVHQVRVIPVVNSRADNDRAFAAREFCGIAPLPRKPDEHLSAESGVFLHPRGRVRLALIVVV